MKTAGRLPTMNEREYRIMAQLEADHWWYRGLRDLLTRVLRASALVERKGLRILDAGCGTGENLRLLARCLDVAYLGGFDLSPLAIDLASEKTPEADLYTGDICRPRLHAPDYDLIISCDVLSETGMAEAYDGMRELTRHLAPQGRFLLNLPAFPWLYSAHDIAVGTRQRTTKAELRDYLQSLGLNVEWISYRVFVLFPAVVLMRLPSLLGRAPRPTAVSDVRATNRLLNHGLAGLLSSENAAILHGFRPPCGSSVFAMARRQ